MAIGFLRQVRLIKSSSDATLFYLISPNCKAADC
jgi:hypothetical protein